jgi:hypothetical protein
VSKQYLPPKEVGKLFINGLCHPICRFAHLVLPIYQPVAMPVPLFQGGTGSEIIPALASGHGRYITVTPEQVLVSVGEWPSHITAINL